MAFEMDNARYFSIGDACQTAYQIRRHTGDSTAFYFDWLITPPNTLDSIYADKSAFFQPGDWSLVEGGTGVKDLRSDITYRHFFKHIPDSDEMVDVSIVDEQMEIARSKFDYLAKKTVAAIKAAPSAVLVRWEWIETTDVARERFAQVRSIFSGDNSNIKVVLVSPVANEEILTGEDLFLKVKHTAEWYGDDASWNRVFATVEGSLVEE